MSQGLAYNTSATATAGETTQVRSDDGRLELTLATPTELGGPGGDATNPEQLLAAGYAACFLSALQYAATRRGMALPQGAKATARLELTHPDEARFAVSVRVEAELPGLESELAQGLIEEAKTAWPYSEPMVGAAPASGGAEAQGQREVMEAREEASGARGYGG